MILEQLYRNWNDVVLHLRLTDRLKASKYHMKKVVFILFFHFAVFCSFPYFLIPLAKES